jgi:hypothetical protein
MIKPKALGGEEGKESGASEAAAIPVNIELGSDVNLPGDVPIYPEAVRLIARQTNKLYIFDYRVAAEMQAVKDFYVKELDRQGWKVQTQQSNSTDGLLYEKNGKSLRIILTRNLKEKAIDIHFFVSGLIAATPTASAPEEEAKKKYLANLGDALKVPNEVPADVPIYPKGEEKIARKPNWHEYRTKDSVDTIATWYGDKMTQNGWVVELDTSELGDSMRIYKKRDAQGNKRTIGVRVNNIKEVDERILTLILFPNNVITAQVEPTSKVTAEQSDAAKKIEGAIKKAQKAQVPEKPKN